MRHSLSTAFGLAVLVAVTTVPATGDPAHLPVGEQRLQIKGASPLPPVRLRPVNPLATSRLLLEDDAPLASFDLDRDLTRRCRAGTFRQQRAHLYIVRLGGYIHGAVIGGRWGLYDPARLAVPDLVYALRWQDTGRCEVYVIRHLQG